MKKELLSILGGVALATSAFAQCPPIISCPANINVSNDPGQCSAVVNYNTPNGIDTCVQGTDTFSFTGAPQFWIVPAGVNQVTIEARGAQGGSNWINNNNFGGIVTADFAVTPGDTLHIYVGGQPTTITGGYNGGGNGEGAGKGGGGASDVRIGGTAMSDRVIVGGGAGGAGYWSNQHVVGGVGGGLTGGPGYRSTTGTPGGDPGTQTGSGNGTCVSLNNPVCTGGFGFGGSSISCGCEGYGGGGGWYGGAGSGNCRGGGGGSGYTLPSATNVNHQSGVQTGHGLVILSYAGGGVTTTMTSGLPSGAQFPVGTTTVSYLTSNSAGSDSCTFTVTVADTGQATVLGALSQDTICTSAGTLTLPAGTPAGGSYSGTGVTGNSFDPAVAQIGTHWVYYTDTVGCQNADSAAITVVWCTGIEESPLADIVKIAPNPSNGRFNVRLPEGTAFETLEVRSIVGKKVLTLQPKRNTALIDLTGYASGTYLIKVRVDGKEDTFRVLKQ